MPIFTRIRPRRHCFLPTATRPAGYVLCFPFVSTFETPDHLEGVKLIPLRRAAPRTIASPTFLILRYTGFTFRFEHRKPLRPLFHFLCPNLKANPVPRIPPSPGGTPPKTRFTSYRILPVPLTITRPAAHIKFTNPSSPTPTRQTDVERRRAQTACHYFLLPPLTGVE